MDTLFNPTPDDDLKQVLAEVPPPIRAFIASGKVQVIAKNLMQKNQLHIDQGAIVGRELILLLLGINTPSEFTQALAGEAQLDQGTINSIVQDVNTQIFVPLREEMRKGPTPLSQQRPQSAAPQAPRPVNAQVPRYAPPTPPMTAPRPASNFNLQNKIPPPARPQGTPSQRSGLRDALAAVTAEKLLEDHEEPHIEFHKTSVPTNLPGALPPRPMQPQPPLPSPKASEGTARPSMRPPYSSDPYREPIEP